ncbi:hypothetical protein L3Q82_007942 [Scortum barcoo]|uniref:Uncharacterized protein n=1 Tax=Scortum barcoo TaxID=214431 RepID=A0ACB8WJG3_9TELE|nr:hypothetical protein L3Q82_007942 [Scortum barcoo]
MEAENMVHSDSMSPASLGICEKLFRRWELKTSLTEGSARRSQQTLTICLGLPGLSNFLLLPADPTHHQVVITVDSSAPLFTRVSKTYSRRSDKTTTKSIIDLQPRVSWCHVH